MALAPYEFWSRCPADCFVHPDDRDALERLPHSFQLHATPNPFFGPLRTAPVVLLYLNPGFHDDDARLARDAGVRNHFAAQRSGDAPLPSAEEYEPAWRWWSRRVGQFGVDPDRARDRIAVLNVCGYRSKSFGDARMLRALPSTAACLDWARSVLFPQAERGERIVVCMRAASWWGLAGTTEGACIGTSLFVPRYTQSGFMFHNAMRCRIKEAVSSFLGQPPFDRTGTAEPVRSTASGRPVRPPRRQPG